MKWYADLAFEAVNAIKLGRGAAAASTLAQEVEDDMKVKIVIRSIRFLKTAQKIPSLP